MAGRAVRAWLISAAILGSKARERVALGAIVDYVEFRSAGARSGAANSGPLLGDSDGMRTGGPKSEADVMTATDHSQDAAEKLNETPVGGLVHEAQESGGGGGGGAHRARLYVFGAVVLTLLFAAPCIAYAYCLTCRDAARGVRGKGPRTVPSGLAARKANGSASNINYSAVGGVGSAEEFLDAWEKDYESERLLNEAFLNHGPAHDPPAEKLTLSAEKLPVSGGRAGACCLGASRTTAIQDLLSDSSSEGHVGTQDRSASSVVLAWDAARVPSPVESSGSSGFFEVSRTF